MIALFFDTETTGFPNPKNPAEIVQIGAVLQDCESKRILGELNVIIKAEKPIPQVVSDIHGITDDLSATFGLDTRLAAAMFAELAKRADRVVAHNIKFDLEIIAGMWPNTHKILMEKEQFCTMLNCTGIAGITGTHAGSNKWPKLIEAYRYFHDGQEFDNAHDAMADVRGCRDVYFALMEKVKVA